MQLRPFKIRCSAIGQIMTNPVKKTDLLSKTTVSYLEKWVKEEIYSRTQDISSKYMDKGNECEDAAIEYAAGIMGWDFAEKNEQFFNDEHFTGTPDLLVGDTVEDIKCSWDCFTFPLFDTELPNKDYRYQLLGYMALTGKQSGGINYCLMDASVELIESEARRQSYARGEGGEVSVDLYDEMSAKMTYSHFPSKLLHKRFEELRDDETIQAIRDRVELCRKYINETILKAI